MAKINGALAAGLGSGVNVCGGILLAKRVNNFMQPLFIPALDIGDAKYSRFSVFLDFLRAPRLFLTIGVGT